MKRLTFITMALALSGLVVAAPPKADLARGKEIATTICAACHAADGNSGIAMYPRLAAQHAAYMEIQTKAIKEGKRTTGMAATMVPLVQSLTDQDIKDVSAYFAKQYPKAGEVDPRFNPALGAKIYRGGLAAKKVPACMSCHGPSGAGMPNIFPRVGGQHADYVVTQMKAFRDGARVHPMMDPIATRLSDDEIKAVANFIQGLH